jgi:hypothetical protein
MKAFHTPNPIVREHLATIPTLRARAWVACLPKLGRRTTHHKDESSYEHKPVNPGGSGCRRHNEVPIRSLRFLLFSSWNNFGARNLVAVAGHVRRFKNTHITKKDINV